MEKNGKRAFRCERNNIKRSLSAKTFSIGEQHGANCYKINIARDGICIISVLYENGQRTPFVPRIRPRYIDFCIIEIISNNNFGEPI